MPDPDDLNEVRFRKHDRERTPPPGYIRMGDDFVTPAFRDFIQAAADGKLPTPDVPERDPAIVAFAQELMVMRLPEFKNPAGRTIGAPTVMKLSNAIRVAEYLIQRGVTYNPEQATIRWLPTPGARLGVDDPGKHIYRNPDGTWPEEPDAEIFWDIEDIRCGQLEDGRWVAAHPNGIECTDDSKSEAYAMCVERVRARIAELKGQANA